MRFVIECLLQADHLARMSEVEAPERQSVGFICGDAA